MSFGDRVLDMTCVVCIELYSSKRGSSGSYMGLGTWRLWSGFLHYYGLLAPSMWFTSVLWEFREAFSDHQCHEADILRGGVLAFRWALCKTLRLPRLR